jgi:hypothetical protein
LSRNAVAVGIVVLDHLRQRCPLRQQDVLSTTGGEVKGARSGLSVILARYSIPRDYLKEATGRQASRYAEALLRKIDYGKPLARVPSAERDRQILAAIELLKNEALSWLTRQNIRVSCDRSLSPAVWVRAILQEAKGRSGGKVEQHLVGAKLQRRHPTVAVPAFPGHAADVQTKRASDFDIQSVSYHVTASPTADVIRKCRSNVTSNRLAVLVVPADQRERAKFLAEEQGLADRITILAFEEFIAQNVIEISTELGQDCFQTLEEIVQEYNRRVTETETDPALRIDLS